MLPYIKNALLSEPEWQINITYRVHGSYSVSILTFNVHDNSMTMKEGGRIKSPEL